MNICGYYPESINEGEGMRAVIYISGCKHYCKGCFNPRTWNFDYGEPFTEDTLKQIMEDIGNNPLIKGVTLCGGDPFFSPEECCSLVQRLKKSFPDIDIWAYTGFTFEELLCCPIKKSLLELCDVVIDGKFEQDKKDVSLPYRGSSNQRIVDVKKSIQTGITVYWK